jgi:hypothetical protein
VLYAPDSERGDLVLGQGPIVGALRR